MKILSMLLLGAAAWGQTAVEYTIATGGATTAAAGMKGAGAAAGGVFGNLNKLLEKANPANSSTQSTATVLAPASQTIPLPAGAASRPADPIPSIKPIDPAQVTVGLERADLLERCGEPSTKVAEKRDSKLLETYWFDTTDRDVLEVKLVDKKVVSATLLSKKKRETAVVR